MILLIDNYDSFTYNLFQYLSELGAKVKVVRNDHIDVPGIRRLDPSAIVISPGPGNPDEAGVSLAVVRELSGERPILGVCLGHQSIGQAFGGRVVRAERMMHGKVSQVYHSNAGVFRGLSVPFTATRYHSLVVEPESLPACLEVTAQTQDCVIMGLRHRTHPTEGVQFHPESIMTDEGKKLLANFLATAAGAAGTKAAKTTAATNANAAAGAPRRRPKARRASA
jgi:anthranilate synthase/aminodeoxychorismate synthase-like glutamine amidotransferase